MSGADVRKTDLSQAYLTDVDLSGADLRQANLKGAKLSGTNLDSANFVGAVGVNKPFLSSEQPSPSHHH